MVDKEEIGRALNVHNVWKIRLRQAIDTGQIDTPLAVIRMNDQCAFGKWLYGSTLDASDRASSHYQVVSDLHAKFHQAAAVAELALSGKKGDAEKMLTLGGAYGTTSARLTGALMEWGKSLE